MYKHACGFRSWIPQELKNLEFPGGKEGRRFKITKDDKAHLAEGTAGEETFLDAVDSAIRSLVRNNIRNPKAQAAALNRMGKRTALNGNWDARLVILLYDRMNRLRATRGLSPISPKDPAKAFKVFDKVEKERRLTRSKDEAASKPQTRVNRASRRRAKAPL